VFDGVPHVVGPGGGHGHVEALAATHDTPRRPRTLEEPREQPLFLLAERALGHPAESRPIIPPCSPQPAALAAAIVAIGSRAPADEVNASILATAVRLVSLRFRWTAPRPRL
jgi:hypothetical protein